MSLTALCLSHTLDSRQNMHMLYSCTEDEPFAEDDGAHGALFSETWVTTMLSFRTLERRQTRYRREVGGWWCAVQAPLMMPF